MNWIKLFAVLAVIFLTACASKPKTSQVDAQRQAVEGRYAEALAQVEQGELEQGKQALQEIAEQHPTYAGPFVNLAIIAYEEENYEQANELLTKALALNPNHKQALNYMGVLARIDGRFAEAETYYRKALAVDPEYRQAIRNLGILLDMYHGKFEEALALYETYQSLQKEPDPKVKDWIFDIKQRLN